MPHITNQQPITELDAFCRTCPPVEEVSALLTTMGFRLEFQMDRQDDLKAVVHLPALPAQYHYRDAYGTEVVFLSGRDTPLDEERFPPHASRFWLYLGASAQAFQLAKSMLALTFQFTWRDPHAEAAPHEEVA